MSLVELVVYIAILTLITLVILNGILQLTGVFGRSRTERRVSLAAETALERIVREIRLAKSINCLSVSYSSAGCSSVASGSSLRLQSYISHSQVSASDVRYKTFYCVGSPCTQIQFDDADDPANAGDDGGQQPLTPSSVTVSDLTFTRLADPKGTTETEGVRIAMTLTSGAGQSQVTHTYYATAVLRGGYTF